MQKNINFHQSFNNVLTVVRKNNKKPKLLLHVCCGPCFTIPHELLKDDFDITIIYSNSNIYPKEEHDRRLDELKKYLHDIHSSINVIELPYDNQNYNKDLEPYGDLPEGHERCRICFRKRFEIGFKYAHEHGFEYYGTVMSISRYKNANDINTIGFELEKQYSPVKWLPADFKKNNGYEKSLLIIREHNMYFQEYCGCIYSYRKYLIKQKDKK